MHYLVLEGNQGQLRILNIGSSDVCFDICAMNLHNILQDTKKWMVNSFMSCSDAPQIHVCSTMSNCRLITGCYFSY